LGATKTIVTSELVIFSIVTHATEDAVKGVIETGAGRRICLLRYRDRVKSMMSYVIDLESGDSTANHWPSHISSAVDAAIRDAFPIGLPPQGPAAEAVAS